MTFAKRISIFSVLLLGIGALAFQTPDIVTKSYATLSSETVRKSYSGDDSTTAFPTTFVFWDDDDLEVTLVVDATGVETIWVRGTNYTVSGGDGLNGTVTAITTPTDYTPATGETLIIRSDLAFTQPTDLPTGGALPAASLEQQFDQVVRQVQQLSEQLGRTPQLKVSSSESGLSLTDLSGNTAKFARVNAAEDGFDYATVTSSGTITDPVPIANGGTNATTAGAALTNLVAAGTALNNIFTQNQNIKSTDAGAAVGPKLVLDRDRASPAASDNLGAVDLVGENDAGQDVIYGRFSAVIVDPADGTEDGRAIVQTMVAGTLTTGINQAQGAWMQGATGTDKGIGTFNAASALYVGGEPANRAKTSNIATTSGTTRDITGIPARTSKITIMLDGVSQDTANMELLLQIGDSSSFEATGYISSIRDEQAPTTDFTTVGFQLTDVVAYDAATLIYAKIDLVHMGGNIWAASYIGHTNTGGVFWHGNGQKTLTGELTRIRLTTVSGAGTFDLGTAYLVAN